MDGIEGTPPKLLFVVSNDFGELSFALHFLGGVPFPSLLLLPERVYAIHRDALPVAARPYRVLADVLAADAAEEPTVVFLCCGYLFAVNGLFPEPDVEALLQRLRERGRRVVTTDPFLGLWSTSAASLIAERHPLKGPLTRHFSWLSRIFTDVVHLYPVRPPETITVPWVSFSKPNIVFGPSNLEAQRDRLRRATGVDLDRRRWLFLLSHEDYGAQTAMHGRERFDDLLAERLRGAVRAGRQPVVIGPPECQRSLTARGFKPTDTLLLTSCPYDLFMAVLLDAEYAFYWNVFSHSVPVRGMNRRPVFFLDHGHLGHALPMFLPIGLRYYYGGAELPFLNPVVTPTSAELETLAAKQEQALEPARQLYAASPSPIEVFNDLLSNH